MNGENNIALFPQGAGVPLDLLEALPVWDGKAYLDERRDAYLKAERVRLERVMAETEGLTMEDLIHLARLAFAAGVRAKADEVMRSEEVDRERTERAMETTQRRLAMRRELRRQEQESEVPEWVRSARVLGGDR